MKDRIGGVVVEAAKVGVVVCCVLALDPWVEQAFPDLPAALRYAVTAVPEVILLEVILQIIFGWPRIDVRWTEHDDAASVSSLVLRANRRTKVAQSVDLSVHASTSGWVGHQILRLWMRAGVMLRIMADEAPISPAVERSSKRDNVATVHPADDTHGVDVQLGPAPRRAGSWHWAEVRWNVTDFPSPDSDFNIDYRLVVPNRPTLTWVLRFIWVRPSARTTRIVRK